MKDRYGFESRKAYGATPLGFSEELWRQYAELGLLGAPFAEEDGGFGGGAVETHADRRRRSAARWRWSPIWRPSCSAAARCATARSAAQREALIPAIAAGELRLALAHAERASGWNLFDVDDDARERTAPAMCSNGEKGLVLHGDSAQKLIVLARTAGGRRDRGRPRPVPRRRRARRASRGAAIRPRTGCARRRSRSPTCASAPRTCIGDPEGAGAVLERVARRGDRGALRRGGRRDERGDGDHDRIPQDAQTVRRRRSARSRRCSTAPPTWWWRSSRRAA